LETIFNLLKNLEKIDEITSRCSDFFHAEFCPQRINYFALVKRLVVEKMFNEDITDVALTRRFDGIFPDGLFKSAFECAVVALAKEEEEEEGSDHD
jgi:hypothetical protein